MQQWIKRYGEAIRRQDDKAMAEATPQQPGQWARTMIGEHKVAVLEAMNFGLHFVLI